jgi:hypothetical protein
MIVRGDSALNSGTVEPPVLWEPSSLGCLARKNKNKMLYCNTSLQADERIDSPFFAPDLCAQLAPLNRYGPTGLAAVVVSGLRALTDVSRSAFCAVAAIRG